MEKDMKKSIHPEMYAVKTNCSCGKEFEIKSTKNQNLRIEVCSACHPFFTGKHRIIDTGGRVEKFNKKFVNIFKTS